MFSRFPSRFPDIYKPRSVGNHPASTQARPAKEMLPTRRPRRKAAAAPGFAWGRYRSEEKGRSRNPHPRVNSGARAHAPVRVVGVGPLALVGAANPPAIRELLNAAAERVTVGVGGASRRRRRTSAEVPPRIGSRSSGCAAALGSGGPRA